MRTTSSAGAAQPPKRSRRLLKTPAARETLRAYLFMAPALIMLAIFVFAPILGSLPLMFMDYSVLGETKFIGLQNFQEAFADRDFQIAMVNTVIFVVVVPIIQILSILLAVLVNRKLRGITVFRTLFYIPVVTSMVAVSIMWGFIFDPNGLINTLLLNMGAIKSPLGFLTDSKTAMLCIMFITIWQGLGYYMMMYLAGLQSIPHDVEEAAMVDGANAAVAFVKVKLPLLKPYIWFCTLNSVISAVGVFDAVYVLTKGGPDNATMVINYYSYIKAFNDFQFGYSAAVGFIQALITGVFSIFVYWYGRKAEEE
ncbi:MULTISPECIES: carbohydrate ABC transporter permease [Caproicibacterium]|uniref:Sugar ABC transporter permease n=1 Tax=Caproicibacterium argilliputei TaxID=3030016 RepID=A0AA97DC87_9FIRM|nr:sugar ABC transporter permease [Caproicibacterium argilliputei]WOC32781.1 sugar ABC transporter permease [Caproicibacterium argilliputei]